MGSTDEAAPAESDHHDRGQATRLVAAWPADGANLGQRVEAEARLRQPGAMATMMQPKDLADLVNVTEPRIGPDGRWVAFTVTTVDVDANRYASRVWVAPVDGTAPPRAFTSGRHRDGRPRWSPRGDELAFVSHRSQPDEQGCELYVAPFGMAGEVRMIATWPEDIEDLAWSPDGTHLAFLARLRDEEQYGEPGEGAKAKEARDQPPRRLNRLYYRLDSVGWTVDRVRQLFVVPADGSARPRAVTCGPYEVDGLSWSPDGTRLAFASGRHDTWDLDWAVDLWITEVSGGEPRQVTETGDVYGSPSWSPDGTRLAFNVVPEPRSEPRHGQIGIVDLDTGASELLTTGLDRNCVPYPFAREPVWDGDGVVHTVEDQGNTHLYRSRTGGPVSLVGGNREVAEFDLRGATLVFCASTPSTTPELFVLDRQTGEERQLTELGRRFSQDHDPTSPVPFTATAPDGHQVQAWIMAPPDSGGSGPRATLLNVHGGPYAQYGNRFFDEFQLQVGAGFAVIYANPRGSSNGREAEARAIRWPEAADDPGSGWGGVDYDDLIAVVDAAVERFDLVDPDRLGVLGGSYGGYMTSWMVGHTDRFKAACSERAANNLLALDQTSDVAPSFRFLVGVSHLDDPGAYLRQSPVSYVEAMTTPMLLIHSEDDLRCPIGQAEELFVALRLLGRNPELVRFPGESHELSRSGSPKHRIMRAEIILDWFRQHLMATPVPDGANGADGADG